MSRVIVRVKDNNDLAELKKEAKHSRDSDIRYYLSVKKGDTRLSDQSVYCLFTNDGYCEEVCTYHLFKDTFPLIEIEKGMFNA